MSGLANLTIKHKRMILALFIAAAAVCAVLQSFVAVNYNMADYLPPDAQSTKALEIMEGEFDADMPNASVMVKDVSIEEALEVKRELAGVPGVGSVMWLDDVADLKKPIETADADTVRGYYKDGNALYTVTIEEGMEQEASDGIRRLIGEDGALAGEAPDLATMQQATGAEVGNAMAILLPIIIAILILSSSSWIEPLLFILTIGISILINMGTNIFAGEVSFMTNSVSPILQLAVSLDYAIFFLHSFADNRKKYGDVNEAVRHAIKESASTIAASAATTLFGFLALTFMNFQIGADLGWNLAKGIILSFVTTMVFLPALTLCTYKLIDKTQHRRLMPNFKNINKVFSKLAVPALVLVLLVIVPAFLGQGQTGFVYGNGSAAQASESGRAKEDIREEFGQSTIMALLVPRGDVSKELALGQEIEGIGHVTAVVSYANMAGTVYPPEFLGEDVTGQFYSDNYARIIVYTNTPAEGDLAFGVVEEINEIARSYYGDTVYSAGESANLYDMKNVVQEDNRFVTILAVIAIFLVLLVTFKSGTLPFILLLTIEAGIWINLAIPYFTGTSINFIGYLVLNTVQLGATVDYAILLTTTYMRNRKNMPQKEAMHRAMGDSFKSILVSAATLATAGFTLYATSSNPAVSDIGLLLGRGTLLSLFMVVCFLPALLKVFDKAIAKTTYKAGFLIDRSKAK
ncbi:efflux RND transporter permease subunit [Christensenella intestinihominis]|uniref:efflux RND transporter permease subunit n=1 Tax=Christensenella intestinihominis TaxID=1851429 RepID=UPI0008370739|nr:MMPL family transporter [Christensenella intestinihominis]